EQQLHDVLGGWIRWLDDEDVVAAHVFIDANQCLSVGKSPELAAAQLDAEMARDLFREPAIRRAGQQLEAVTGDSQAVHAGSCEVSQRKDCEVVAPGGFDPPFSDRKSEVLPLDEGAASPQSYSAVSTCTTRSLVRVIKASQSLSRAIAAVSGGSENTPKTADPDPASRERSAPREARSSTI